MLKPRPNLTIENVQSGVEAYKKSESDYLIAIGGGSSIDTAKANRKAAIDAVKKLSSDIGIPLDLKYIVKEEDIQFLAESAYNDACRPGNPKETSIEEIAELYRSLI